MWHCLPSAGARSVLLREVWPCFHSTRCSKESLGASRVPVLLSFLFFFLARCSLYFFIKLHPLLKACIQIAIYNLFTDPSPSRTRGWQQAPRPPSVPRLLLFPFCFSALPAFPRRKVPALLFPRFPCLAAYCLKLSQRCLRASAANRCVPLTAAAFMGCNTVFCDATRKAREPLQT